MPFLLCTTSDGTHRHRDLWTARGHAYCTHAYTGPWIFLLTQIHELHTWLSVRIWTRELIPIDTDMYTQIVNGPGERRGKTADGPTDWIVKHRLYALH
jgi:hypothetical protein